MAPVPDISAGLQWRGSNSTMWKQGGSAGFPDQPVLFLTFGGHQATFEMVAGIFGGSAESHAYARVSYNDGSGWTQLRDWYSLDIISTDDRSAYTSRGIVVPPDDGIDWIVDPMLGHWIDGGDNTSSYPRINWPWHLLEMRVQASSSVGAADGVLTVLIDGVSYYTTTREIPVSADDTDIVFRSSLQGDIDAAWVRYGVDAPTFDSEGIPTTNLQASARFAGGVFDTTSHPGWTSWRNTPFFLPTGGRDDTAFVSAYSGDPSLYNAATAGTLGSAYSHFKAGVSTVWSEDGPRLFGSTVFGTKGTVQSTRTFLANLDDTTRSVNIPGTFYIGGDLIVTGSSTIGGGAVSTVDALDDLSDVTITAPVQDSYLAFDGAQWINTAPLLRTVFVTLTDAQVKALPTTPVTILAALGSGYYVSLHSVEIQTKFTSGAYTNINATYAAIAVALEGSLAGGAAASMLVADDSAQTPAITMLTQLWSAASQRVKLLPYLESNPAYVLSGSSDGSYGINLISDCDNKTLKISADNNGSGNFTGGNAANSMKVIVYYTIEPVP